MKTSIKLYDYNLPENLIARYPTKNREDSKLMIIEDRNSIEHRVFKDLPNHIQKGDLLILNDTKVIPGRLFLKKDTGGIVEILFHKSLNYFTKNLSYSSDYKILYLLFIVILVALLYFLICYFLKVLNVKSFKTN